MTYVHLMQYFGTLCGGSKSHTSIPPTPLSPRTVAGQHGIDFSIYFFDFVCQILEILLIMPVPRQVLARASPSYHFPPLPRSCASHGGGGSAGRPASASQPPSHLASHLANHHCFVHACLPHRPCSQDLKMMSPCPTNVGMRSWRRKCSLAGCLGRYIAMWMV